MHIDNIYYSIFMNAVEGIFQSTPDGQYLNVNPSLAKMYGYDSPSELMRSVNNIASQLYVNPDRRQEFIDEMAANGIVKDFVSQIYRKDKTKIWITENVRIVRDENGTPQYYEGFVADITQLIKAKDRNKTLQTRLQQAEKLETIGRMANGIAHDFGNILSPILGYTDLLLEMVPSEDKISKFIERISVSAKRGKDLVRQIHSFGRPGPDKEDPVKIESIVDEVIMMLKDTSPDTIKFSKKVEKDLPHFLGDPTQIHQIIFNLGTNAVHALEENGGSLFFKIKQKTLSKADIDQMMLDISPGHYLQIYVKDTGTGIPLDVVNKIFDPYFTTKEKGKGTGLGLATVHSIIKSYKGEIILKSTPGKGTTFKIYLPAMDEDMITTSEMVYNTHSIQQMEPETEKKHIMLVDDDQDVLHVQGHLLQQLGYLVSMYEDGKSALKSFLSDPDQFDLVLTDFHMPEMTGLDLSRSLLQVKSQLPIILCTGYRGSVDESTTKAAGIRELMFKPLTMNILNSRMQALLFTQTVGHA